jgi:hypothetical protein
MLTLKAMSGSQVLRIIFALIAIGLLSVYVFNFDRYEIKVDTNGNTIRLDKRTGEVMVRDRVALQFDRIQSPDEVEAEERATQAKKEAEEASKAQVEAEKRANLVTQKANAAKWKTLRDALIDPDFHDLSLEQKRSIVRKDPDGLTLDDSDIDDILGQTWNKYSIPQEKRAKVPLPATLPELYKDPWFHKQSVEEKRLLSRQANKDFGILDIKDQDEILGKAYDKYASLPPPPKSVFAPPETQKSTP